MLTHHTATILGDIPDDWSRELLVTLLAEQKGGDWGDETGDVALKVLRSTNFTDRGTLDFADVAVRRFGTAKAQNMGLRRYDILLERSGGGPTQPVGRVGFIESDLADHWCSNFVQLLRPNPEKIDPQYLGWVLHELNRTGVVERLQHQTTQMRNLDFREYLRVYLPKPPRHEQERIAKVLLTTNKIVAAADAKLTAAQRLKSALMQQLFTRGTPGRHARFRVARVFRAEFEIPATWDMALLGHSVTKVEYGTNAASNDGKHGLPVVAIPEVVAPRFRLGDCSYGEVPSQEAQALRLRPDDVLLIRTNGNPEYIGKSTVIGEEAADTHIIFASYLIRVQTEKSRLSGRYLNYFLASPLGRRQCLAMANTSAGNHNIGSRAIRRFALPRPEPDEQNEIVALVDSAEDAIEASLRELQALNSLKRSLLQNLLTGRIRIRN